MVAPAPTAPRAIPPMTPPQIPRPPRQISKAWYQCPLVSAPQLVSRLYSRAPISPPGTPQSASAAMVPGWPPICSQRRWDSQTAAAIPQAMSRP